jgi:hypothetical protein
MVILVMGLLARVNCKSTHVSDRGITRAARDGIVASVFQDPVAGTLGGAGGGALHYPGRVKGFSHPNDELVLCSRLLPACMTPKQPKPGLSLPMDSSLQATADRMEAHPQNSSPKESPKMDVLC